MNITKIIAKTIISVDLFFRYHTFFSRGPLHGKETQKCDFGTISKPNIRGQCMNSQTTSKFSHELKNVD